MATMGCVEVLGSYRENSTAVCIECSFQFIDIAAKFLRIYFLSLQHTQNMAKKQGIVGWVQNTPRGTVVGVVQGPTANIETMYV